MRTLTIVALASIVVSSSVAGCGSSGPAPLKASLLNDSNVALTATVTVVGADATHVVQVPPGGHVDQELRVEAKGAYTVHVVWQEAGHTTKAEAEQRIDFEDPDCHARPVTITFEATGSSGAIAARDAFDSCNS